MEANQGRVPAAGEGRRAVFRSEGGFVVLSSTAASPSSATMGVATRRSQRWGARGQWHWGAAGAHTAEQRETREEVFLLRCLTGECAVARRVAVVWISWPPCE